VFLLFATYKNYFEINEDSISLVILHCIESAEYYIPVGNDVEFRCREGFWTNPSHATSQTVTCLNNRSYSPAITSLSDCIAVSCAAPPSVSNMHYIFSFLIFFSFFNSFSEYSTLTFLAEVNGFGSDVDIEMISVFNTK